MESLITVKCVNCGSEFCRRAAEVKRNEKRGRQIFCSRACHGKYNYTRYGSRLGDKLGVIGPNFYRKKDPNWIFNRHMALIKKRAKIKNRDVEIDSNDLKGLWESQKGICPYTGWQLEHSSGKRKKKPNTASVDRVDSTKGYVKDNIEFVALIVQYAKNDWQSSVIKEFAEAVLGNQKWAMTTKPC